MEKKKKKYQLPKTPKLRGIQKTKAWHAGIGIILGVSQLRPQQTYKIKHVIEIKANSVLTKLQEEVELELITNNIIGI